MILYWIWSLKNAFARKFFHVSVAFVVSHAAIEIKINDCILSDYDN